MSDTRTVVAIATPFEAELVAPIAAVDDRLDVRYEPELLPPVRFPCDHRGVDSFTRSVEQEQRWRVMLTEADVLFGLPGDSSQGLADAIRTGTRLRWVQATAGRAEEQVRSAELSAVAHGVVVPVPLTDETRGMIDAAAFERMRSAAVLADISSGSVVDNAALVHALEAGWLAGAALDVFATEPLPTDSPLWQLPNVLLSPHTAGLSVRENEQFAAGFIENLGRSLTGTELLDCLNPPDVKSGS